MIFPLGFSWLSLLLAFCQEKFVLVTKSFVSVYNNQRLQICQEKWFEILRNEAKVRDHMFSCIIYALIERLSLTLRGRTSNGKRQK